MHFLPGQGGVARVERKTRRIRASANRSFDYNVRASTPRRGRVIPFAGRKSKPQPRANRNDRYILRRSGRAEPTARASPARFKIVPPMHPILSRPLGVARSRVSHREIRPLNISRILAHAAILLCLSSGLDSIWIL